jgi:hypothetical protein
MIIDAIVGTLMFVLEAFLGLLPSFELDGLSGFGPSLGGSMAAAGTVFPVGTLGLCLAAVLSVWLFIHAWKLVVYVYSLIPFKAT